MTRSLSVLALLVVFARPAAAQDIQGPSWKPLSIEVRKPDAEKNAFSEVNAGTRVVAKLELPGKKLVAIDTKKSKLDSYTDDKDSNLLTVPAGAAARLGALLAIRADTFGKLGDITFHAPTCPTRGATRVRIKGSVVALIGREEKEIEKKDFSLKSGGELDFGSFKSPKLALGSTRTETSTRLTYEGTKAIISVTVLDSDGKELPCRFTSLPVPAALTKSPFRGGITITSKTADRCTLKVKYFDSVEEVTVPVDLEIGLGF